MATDQGQGQGAGDEAEGEEGDDLACLCDAYDNGSVNGQVHKQANGFMNNALAQAAGVSVGADDVSAAGVKIQSFCATLGVNVTPADPSAIQPHGPGVNGNSGTHGPPEGKGPTNPHAHGALSHGHGKP